MNFFHQGGVMMWPLALVSVTVLAIVIDRMLLLFSSVRFPGKNFARILSDALASNNMEPLVSSMRDIPVLKDFVLALEVLDAEHRERILEIRAEDVVRTLEKHLSLMAVLARLTPLLGLLRTILGMITTFAHIADSS